MTKEEMLEDELTYLESLDTITVSDQVIEDLFAGKEYTRIPRFFHTQGKVLTKIILSLDRAHVKAKKEIVYALDKGTLVAFIPVKMKPTFKSPSEVFYDRYE